MGTLIKVTSGDNFVVDLPLQLVMQTFGNEQPLASFDTTDGRQVGIAVAAVVYAQDYSGGGHGPPVGN